MAFSLLSEGFQVLSSNVAVYPEKFV